jgi:putative CRISPR-associated protein (TIGR02619 family)
MGRLIICTVGTSLLDDKKNILEAAALSSLKSQLIGRSGSVKQILCDRNLTEYLNKAIEALKNRWEELQNLSSPRPAQLKDHLEKLPAEVCSLRALGVNENDVVVFIYSDTGEGAFCAACLRALLQDKCIARCLTCDNASPTDLIANGGVRKVEKLDAERPEDFEQAGIPNLFNAVMELLDVAAGDTNVNVIVDVTGGYKPQSLYAALMGLLSENVKVYFLHEQSLGKAIPLPELPIDFALLEWEANAAWMQYILDLPADQAEQYKQALPSSLQKLLVRKDNRYNLTSFGQAIQKGYERRQRKIAEDRTGGRLLELINDNSLKEKLLKRFLARHKFLLEGNQIPEAVDHGLAHAQRLLEFAAQLLLPMGDNFLNPEELYLLINCLWLHDIGCAGGSLRIDDNEVPITSPDLVRRLHNLLTEVRLKEKPKEYGFEEGDEQERDLIAKICKYNRRKMPLCDGDPPFKVNVYGYKYKISNPINESDNLCILGRQVKVRTRLLAALLRVIDACDEQKARAGAEEYQAIRLGVTEEEAKRAEERRKQMKKIVEHFAKLANFSSLNLDDESWKGTVKSLRQKSCRSQKEEQLLEVLTLYWDLYDAAHFREHQEWHFNKHSQIEWARFRPPKEENGVKHFVLELKPIEKAEMKFITNPNPGQGEEKGAKEEIEEDFKSAQPVLKQVGICLSVEVI